MDSIQYVGFFFQMEKMRIRKVPVSSSCLVHSQPLKTTWRSLWGSAQESLLLRGKHTESGLSEVVFVLFYLCSITESLQQWILNGHIDLGVFLAMLKVSPNKNDMHFFSILSYDYLQDCLLTSVKYKQKVLSGPVWRGSLHWMRRKKKTAMIPSNLSVTTKRMSEPKKR